MTRRRVARGATGVAVLLLAAELAGRTGLVDRSLIPLISEILARAAGLVVDPLFLADLQGTLVVWATGLLVAVAIAVPLGLFLGTLRRAELAARPLVEFLRPIPSVALLPLIALLVPDDAGIKITAVVYAAAWPVLVNTMYGLRDVDPVAKETLRSFGFGRLAVLMRVCLPSAAPFVLTGVRLATAIGLIVAVSAELITGGTAGIGTFMIRAGSGMRTDLVLAAALWAGILGLVANALLLKAQRLAFRWHAVTAEAAT
ncbi:nitrate ABC transporter permease [Sphaerisporangium siamense]|uniref:NitT/TauT family transport system permease protein n=1 Tax=Sphaerisporangium siamense TaxID=795645 RepID=A0A7W7GEK2_9ACTN|nr:ABC transporter permease subunit [Sphaerisporangium siamense]MBB4705549.1 NitT/TauT family transport system permease protein [Sphaerisporangium siamense]GII83071.1 nitrate ABC transporter permease [Sphaerisporangium siamense]